MDCHGNANGLLLLSGRTATATCRHCRGRGDDRESWGAASTRLLGTRVWAGQAGILTCYVDQGSAAFCYTFAAN